MTSRPENILKRKLPKGYSVAKSGSNNHFKVYAPDGSVLRHKSTGMPVTISGTAKSDNWIKEALRDLAKAGLEL